MPPAEDTSDASKRQRGGSTKTGTGSTKAAKTSGKKSTESDEAAKKLGLLCYDGTPERLPFLNIRFKKTPGAKNDKFFRPFGDLSVLMADLETQIGDLQTVMSPGRDS